MSEGQEQCPTCGRVSEDWSKRNEEIKGKQRQDAAIDRTADYRAWRQTWGGGCFTSDLDQVEWRIIDGKVVPLVVLELTRLDGNVAPPPSYFEAIENRFRKRDGQGTAVVDIACRIGVDVVIVLFRHDLSEFWIHNLTTGGIWYPLTQDKFRRWLEGHKGRKLTEAVAP